MFPLLKRLLRERVLVVWWAGAVSVFVCLATLGCGPARTLASSPCPDGGTQLTYVNFGRSFMARYCQSCHASDARARAGAPSNYTFDDLPSIVAWRDRVFERSAAENDTMPPGPDDPPFAERMRLAEWLSCGPR